MSKGVRSIALFVVLVLGLMLVPFNQSASSEQRRLINKRQATSDDLPRYRAVPSREDAGFVIRKTDGEASCRATTPKDDELFNQRDRAEAISHVGEGITTQATGLTIVLKALRIS